MKTPSLLWTLLATVQLSACADVASSPEELTFEEFEAQTYREPWPGGMYIVDSDVTVRDEAALREVYEQSRSASGGLGVATSALIVNRVGSTDDKWSDAERMNITYCVSNTFGADKARVVQAMNAAAASWEEGGLVNFVHVAALDASCTANQAGVVFDVRPAQGTWLARSFRPSYARAQSNLILSSTALGPLDAPMTLTGVVRHELGHVLGFDHEHTRPEAGRCFEDSEWRALTPYDAASAMNSPSCTDSPNPNFELTARDREGLAALYPPLPPPPPPVEGVERTFSVSGSVTRGQWQHYSAITVKPGTSFTANMAGTGDADLYVRFGSAPTQSAFDCRPFLDTSSESCSLLVPAGKTTAYISVRGWAGASSYSLSGVYYQ
jgi:serine protease